MPRGDQAAERAPQLQLIPIEEEREQPASEPGQVRAIQTCRDKAMCAHHRARRQSHQPTMNTCDWWMVIHRCSIRRIVITPAVV